MIKSFLIAFCFIFVAIISGIAQVARKVDGRVVDSNKVSIPRASIKLVSDKDSFNTVANDSGKFVFPSVSGNRFTLTISSVGYLALRRHYTFDNDTAPAVLKPIILGAEPNTLQQVYVRGANPVILKEDTVEYT